MAIFISMYNDKRTQMCILVEQRGSKCLSVSNLFQVPSWESVDVWIPMEVSSSLWRLLVT